MKPLDPAYLRMAQRRILMALYEAKRPMRRAELAVTAKTNRHNLTRDLGSDDPMARQRSDAAYWPSLLSLGLVRCVSTTSGNLFTLTVAGLRAVDQILRRKLPLLRPKPVSKPPTAPVRSVRHSAQKPSAPGGRFSQTLEKSTRRKP